MRAEVMLNVLTQNLHAGGEADDVSPRCGSDALERRILYGIDMVLSLSFPLTFLTDNIFWTSDQNDQQVGHIATLSNLIPLQGGCQSFSLSGRLRHILTLVSRSGYRGCCPGLI